MKKYVLLLVMVVSILLGCVSMKIPSPDFEVSITDGEIEELEIKIEPLWLERGFSFSTKHYKPGIAYFWVSFNNKSNELIKILWEESSIIYDGSSYVPFLAGQKYVDAGSPPPPTIIPKNASVDKDIYSSGQVEYSGGEYGMGWYTTTIGSKKSILVFCIEKAGAKKYVTVEVLAKSQEEVPPLQE